MSEQCETCFVSNLPLEESGETRIVAIPVASFYGRYMPVGLPVRGLYDGLKGIKIDDSEMPLITPLLEEAKRVSTTLSHDFKSNTDEELRGVGLHDFHRNLHLGELNEKGEPREFIWCGETAWLQYSKPTFGSDPTEDLMVHLPASWCFMLEEVYDYFLTYDFTIRSYRESPSIYTEKETRDAIGRVLRREEDYGECWYYVQDLASWPGLSGFSIYPYVGIGENLTDDMIDRFHELFKVQRELLYHRTPLRKGEGTQFGCYHRHQKLATLCKTYADRKLEDILSERSDYKDPYDGL